QETLGASGGIGLEVTRQFLGNGFLEQGARVTAHYNTKASPLEPLVSQNGPEHIQALQADLTNESAVETLFKNAVASFGNVHVLILNHAIYEGTDQPVFKMPLEQWNHTINTNLTSTFIVAKEYVRRLEGAPEIVKDYASIIMIGSSAGKFGEAGHADYAASKSAMMYGFLLSLKNEIVKIAPRARVNCIAPGWTRTPLSENSLKDPEVVYKALATTPLKKVAMPSDIASQVVIHASRKVSGHVTGQVLMITGGMEGECR
ncbi:hypothetical protein AGABI1DRAFT_44696, partial [Agaricus bisporus var. burnettii JB137-S8]